MACSSGFNHTITVSDDGVVHSFGQNCDGQLGLGHYLKQIILPNPILNLPKIKEISCGFNFTVCIDNEGELWSFGQNNYGQLGTGDTTNYNNPQKIADIPPVRSVSCGGYHVLIITNDSNLWSCGINDAGQLCLGNTENQSKYHQTSFEYISKISAGGFHSLFQNSQGEIFGCGRNNHGQIGLGHFDRQIDVTRIPIVSFDTAQFCSGCYHSLFLDSIGNVFSVGQNQYGNLGLGHNNIQNVLNQIPNIPPIRMISCVGYSSYLIDFDGNIWSFGYGINGQLGHGDNTNRNVPTKIESLNNITQTVQGSQGNHFLAKNSQNKIFVVGCNTNGQLGIGNYTSVSSPQEIQTQYSQIWGGNPQIL